MNVKDLNDHEFEEAVKDLKFGEYSDGYMELPFDPKDIDHPNHYGMGGIECIDAIKSAVTGYEGFDAYCTGNVIKYMWRWKWKNGVKDLYKAAKYIEFLIDEHEG